MIKLKPTAGTLAANATIPLTQVFNTNSKLALSNNSVAIREAGLVEVDGTISVTATAAGSVTLIMYVDGTAVTETTFTDVFAAIGDTATIPIYEAFRVIPQNLLNGFADVSFAVNSACTITNGVITMKYIR